MEAKLHEAEEEVIKAKAENFRLVKTFANTRNQFQVIHQGFKAMDEPSSLVERVESLEKLLREINLDQRGESGFVSHVSSSSASPERSSFHFFPYCSQITIEFFIGLNLWTFPPSKLMTRIPTC